MHLIDHDFQPILRPEVGKTYADYPFWEYNPLKKRFILVRLDAWSMIQSPGYHVAIGKHKITIPVNHYVLIGDVDAGIDFIKMDEILSREFDVLTFSQNLEDDSWGLEPLKVLGYTEEMTLPYPQTKKPVAVHLGGERAIMVTTVDQYSKMGTLSFNDIV